MSPNWLLVGSPLVLLGVPLVLFADRNLDHQRQNMREGKEYLWQEKFRPKIGELIHELDREHELASEFDQAKEQYEDKSRPNPEGVRTLEDIPPKILGDAPYTPSLRNVTDSIGKQSQKMSNLEDHYQDLEGDLQWLGVSLIAAYGILGYGQFEYGFKNIPGFLITIVLLALAFGIHRGHEYIKKKRTLRRFADKYEDHREL